jgi:hypothetical protein
VALSQNTRFNRSFHGRRAPARQKGSRKRPNNMIATFSLKATQNGDQKKKKEKKKYDYRW